MRAKLHDVQAHQPVQAPAQQMPRSGERERGTSLLKDLLVGLSLQVTALGLEDVARVYWNGHVATQRQLHDQRSSSMLSWCIV